MFLLFGSTLVVKIKKMQESTPRFLKRITEDNENTILPFFATASGNSTLVMLVVMLVERVFLVSGVVKTLFSPNKKK